MVGTKITIAMSSSLDPEMRNYFLSRIADAICDETGYFGKNPGSGNIEFDNVEGTHDPYNANDQKRFNFLDFELDENSQEYGLFLTGVVESEKRDEFHHIMLGKLIVDLLDAIVPFDVNPTTTIKAVVKK